MKQQRLEFTAPGQVEVKTGPPPRPTAHQVVVQTHYSAISPGTEMLVYRDQWPRGISIDSTIDALAGAFAYPLAYGYSTVGRVIALGTAVSPDWLDRRVFCLPAPPEPVLRRTCHPLSCSP